MATAKGKSTRSTGTKKRTAATGARKTATRAKAGSSTRKTLSLSARPHKKTTSGRPLFEPIEETPSERAKAGEKLPKYIRNVTKEWTKADVKELKAHAKENMPTRVIGLKLGRSVASVRAKAAEEGISLMPPNRSPYGVAGKKRSTARTRATAKRTSARASSRTTGGRTKSAAKRTTARKTTSKK